MNPRNGWCDWCFAKLSPSRARAIGRDLKGYARQTQEAGGVGSGDETVDEGRFDLVEVRLRRDRIRRAVRLVRRLPLDRGALGMRVIVSRPVWRMDVVMMMVIVHVVMIMSMFMHIVMMAVMVMTHGGPQYATGLLMIDLWLPSLPCATIEPRASTTTRTPTSAVMSEVS